MRKPRSARGYNKDQTTFVRATCLYIATKLGELLDELIVVGGLVPTLIVDQRSAADEHIGTMDLDIGLQVALLSDKRYEELTDRLQRAGFSPDANERGVRTRQRWKIDGPPRVTVDFLIPPSLKGDKGGDLRDIQPDFAAIIAPGLRVAFLDSLKVSIEGETIKGEKATREIQVCGAAAFIVMKALALRIRGDNKDAYDIVYMVRNAPKGIDALAADLRTLLLEPEAKEALGYLDEDFATVNSIGPRRYSEFLYDDTSDEAVADAWGAIRTLLTLIRN